MIATRTVLSLWFLIAACGSGSGDRDAGDRMSDPPLGGGFAMRLDVDPDPPVRGRPVTWTLTVRNEGVEAVELTFSSGKSGDVVLLEGGREAYRWSADRFFTEAIRRVTLQANAEQEFTLDEPGLSVAPGSYELVATLASDPAPEPVRRSILVVDQ